MFFSMLKIKFDKNIKFFEFEFKLTKILSLLVHCRSSLQIKKKKTISPMQEIHDYTLAAFGKNAISIYTP